MYDSLLLVGLISHYIVS